jgi:predicted metalloprotease
MRWTPGGESSDIEDRRGSSGFGFGGVPIGIGGAVVLLILSLVFGKNFFAIFQGSPSSTTSESRPVEQSPQESREVQFVSFVLDDAQSTWEKILRDRYRHAKLVLFRDAISSACGFAQAASGPFYCPIDEKVYLDLGFFDEMRDRFAATGDFAQAYVITHEIGHHVQKLLGIQRHGRSASVAIELQADCFAGIWAHSTSQRNILESGDVEEGLTAAAAVGDDRLQRMSGRRINPDSFTHGSSQQRAAWFRRGFDSGRIEDCDTFRAGAQIRQ